MDPQKNLYGGISEVSFPPHQFDFGEGVVISPTKAHLMRPFLMTFERPETSFPAMQNASGSFGFDIVAEIKIPAEFNLPDWFDRPNTIWWLAALIRLRTTSQLRIPVLSSESFSNALNVKSSFWPVEPESENSRLLLDPISKGSISDDDLNWVRRHWITGGRLMRTSHEFNLAFQAFDQSTFTRDPTLALLLLWSALEPLFSPAKAELRFRISANIATFLEHAGSKRAALQKEIAKLYDARSAAAHGGSQQALKPLTETYTLMRRILLRMVDGNRVPTIAEIEASLFGGVA